MSHEVSRNRKMESTKMRNKKPVGRPSKYRPEMCDVVIKLMKEGASKCEVAAALDVDDETLIEWAKKYPEFSATIKRAEQLSSAWWQREGRTSLRDKSFSYVGWYMQMKNRFGWTDTQKVKLDGNLHIHID